MFHANLYNSQQYNFPRQTRRYRIESESSNLVHPRLLISHVTFTSLSCAMINHRIRIASCSECTLCSAFLFYNVKSYFARYIETHGPIILKRHLMCINYRADSKQTQSRMTSTIISSYLFSSCFSRHQAQRILEHR